MTFPFPILLLLSPKRFLLLLSSLLLILLLFPSPFFLTPSTFHLLFHLSFTTMQSHYPTSTSHPSSHSSAPSHLSFHDVTSSIPSNSSQHPTPLRIPLSNSTPLISPSLHTHIRRLTVRFALATNALTSIEQQTALTHDYHSTVPLHLFHRAPS